MFDRIFFSLSMFLFRVFQGFTGGGHVGASASKADEPFYVNSFESFQDFDHDRH